MQAAWNEQRTKDIIAAHRGEEGPMLPILHDIQHEFGHVPQPALPLLAESLNLSRAEVHGIVTFYRDFREAPPGRHVLKLCRAEACQSMGSEKLAEQILKQLNVEWGGTTPDNRITLEATYCLGLCACAPAVMLDGEVHGRVDAEAAQALIREARR